MRKYISLILGLVLLVTPAFASNQDKVVGLPYTIASRDVKFDTIKSNKNIYTALDQFKALFGFNVTWKQNKLTIESRILYGGCQDIVVYDFNKNEGYYYNAKDAMKFKKGDIKKYPSYKKLSTMPIKKENKFYVPMTELCTAMGFEVVTYSGVMNIGDNTRYIYMDKEVELLEQLVEFLDMGVCGCPAENKGHVIDKNAVGGLGKFTTDYGMPNNFECFLIRERTGLNAESGLVSEEENKAYYKVASVKLNNIIKAFRSKNGNKLSKCVNQDAYYLADTFVWLDRYWKWKSSGDEKNAIQAIEGAMASYNEFGRLHNNMTQCIGKKESIQKIKLDVLREAYETHEVEE